MKIVQIITIPEQLNHGKCKPIQAYVDDNGCHVCTSHSLRDGDYSSVTRNGKNQLVHREVYEFYFGPIPMGMIVRHTCHNTRCINPAHLILGTQWDNMQDKVKAGRQPRGSGHPSAKLNEEKVYYIRYVSEESNKDLAEKYGVTQNTIYSIRKNLTWKHVTQEYKYSGAA